MSGAGVHAKMAGADPTGDPDEMPTFATEDEAREFWATYDSALYFARMEDVSATPPADLGIGPGRAGSTARRRPVSFLPH